MREMIALSPTILVNIDKISAVETVTVEGKEVLAVYVEDRVFMAINGVDEILKKIVDYSAKQKSLQDGQQNQFWAGR